MSRNLCNDLIKRCDNLLKENFTKFYKYAEHQETLRLKFIETNIEYKFFKTWLHTAFEDTITLKPEHGDLTRLYQILLKNNLIKEFIDYFTNKEMVQLKYIEAINQCKNLRTSLDVTNKGIVSLKSERDDLTRHYGAFLPNGFVDELLNLYASEQEALRLKFTETIDKCERLNTALDEAYEAVIMLISEHDEIVKRYQELSEINIVKEFLDYAKYRETIRLKFTERITECKCTESCLDQAVTEAHEMLDTERLEREQIENERDSLVYLSDELCRLLLDYQRHTLSNDNREKYAEIRESIEQSINNGVLPSDYSNNIAESDTSSISEISLLESKDDILDINPCNGYLDEGSNESIVVKSETPDVAAVFLEAPANETLQLPSSHFDHNNLFVENSDVTALSPDVDRQYCPLMQAEIPSVSGTRELNGEIQQSPPAVDVFNLTLTLTQSQLESVLHGKPSPKKRNPFKSAHALVETESLLCDQCGQSFDAKKCKQCPICNTVRSNKRDRRIKMLPTIDILETVPNTNITNGVDKGSDSRCDICLRNYSSKNSLKKHIRAVHDKQKPYKCLQCDKTFSAKCNLKSHAIVHSSEKPFPCSTCHECFRDPSSKRRHEQSFHGEARFFCAHCDQRFFRKDRIARHIQKEHFSNCNRKKFKCKICAKLLASKQILNRHCYRVHNSKRSNEGMRRHVRVVHSKNSDFHCAHCDKSYFEKSHLAKHLQKHGFVIT